MSNIGKTKEQLLSELAELRQRVVALEILEHERQRTQNTLEASLMLIQKTGDMSAELFMQLSLEEAVRLSESTVGFFHFISADQKTINRQLWSNETLKRCYVSEKDQHDSIDQAGVWVDCIRQRNAVIHNDYAGLPHKKGLPGGHIPIIREMAVPVFDSGKIVAVMGVGNKPHDYEQLDISQLSLFAETAWALLQRKQAENALKKAYGEMETRVGEGTVELITANQQLRQEISERKQVEEALRDSEEKFRSLYTSISHGIALHEIVRDEIGKAVDYRILDVNFAYETITGLSKEQSTGKLASELYGIEEPPYLEIYAEVIASRKPISFEIYFAPMGKHLDITAFSPIVGQFATIFTDITERKQAEKEHLQLILEKERIQILTDFINKASHEFKTPLATINTSTYLLGKVTDIAQKEKYKRKVIDQVQAITALVDAMITMSRLDTGEALTFSEVDLNEIIFLIRDSRQIAFREKNLNLVLQLSEKPLLIQGDHDYLGDVVNHILDNAIRHTPDGGTITVRSDHVEDNILLEFIDSGPGVDNEHLPHIFERFYRADMAGTTRGFGLGLPLARSIIERHGGRIEIESTPGKGTSFVIVLPTT